MTNEVNAIWTPELKGYIREEFPKTAAYVGNRFQDLPTPKELIISCEAASRYFIQKGQTRFREATLIMDEMIDRNNQGITEGYDEAFDLHMTAINESVADFRASELLSKSANLLSQFENSSEARHFYALVTDEIIAHVRHNPLKTTPNQHGAGANGELAVAIVLQTLPQRSKERFQKLLPPSATA